MKLVRILILLFMGGVVFLMVVFPFIFDSSRLHKAYTSLVLAPSEANGRAVEEAKRQDRADIQKFECIFAGMLVLAGFAFRRAGATKHGH